MRSNLRTISISWTGKLFCSCVLFACWCRCCLSCLPLLRVSSYFPFPYVNSRCCWVRLNWTALSKHQYLACTSAKCHLGAWSCVAVSRNADCPLLSLKSSSFHSTILLFFFLLASTFSTIFKAQKLLWILLCFFPWLLISSFLRPEADIWNEMANCENIFY